MEYRLIDGFKGKYEVSECGVVRNTSTLVPIKSHLTNHNNPRKRLTLNGRKYYVHRIVALTWLPSADKEDAVNVIHLDGNPLNNHASNLCWATPLESTLYGFEAGIRTHVGINNPASRLTVEDVIDIRSSSASMRELAEKYNIAPNTVSNIRSFRCWKSIK